MRLGFFDIETNGITDWDHYSDLTDIHCICIYDTQDQKVHRYNTQRGDVEKALDHLKECDAIVGHNSIGFDAKVLEKRFGFKHHTVYDTLVMARCIYPDLRNDDSKRRDFDKKLTGSHKLEAWGKRIGSLKGDFGASTDWSAWSQEMEDYCAQDVMVTKELYYYLTRNPVSPQMLTLEHKFATIIREQEQNGFPFDVEKAKQLTKKLMIRRVELEEELQKVFPPRTVAMKSCWWNTVDGRQFPTKKAAVDSGYKAHDITKGAPKTREVPFNPSSRDQIAERLIENGWKPKAFEGKRPAINEGTLKDIGTEQSGKLLEYLLIAKRLGAVAEGAQAWMKAEKNGRVHGRVNTNGTLSGRCAHNRPNMGQVPATRAPYGGECRELFTAPRGKVLVGCDASGLELRCLAHYLHAWDDGAYGRKIVEDDIHTVNQKAAGLETRDQAKTFIYAWLYGAGDAKIGSIVGGNAQHGKRLKENFLSKLPAVKRLMSAVKAKVDAKGILIGLDGRKLPVRSAHSALNLLLQSAGAVVMKQALIEFVFLATKPYEMHANVHDEVQFSCLEEDAEVLGEEFVTAIRLAGMTLKFKCPLDGEYNVGANWKETH